MNKLTMRVTVGFEYEIDLDDPGIAVAYDTDDPVKMAAIDQDNFAQDPGALAEELANAYLPQVSVIPVIG
jgi:hypothetical protein